MVDHDLAVANEGRISRLEEAVFGFRSDMAELKETMRRMDSRMEAWDQRHHDREQREHELALARAGEAGKVSADISWLKKLIYGGGPITAAGSYGLHIFQFFKGDG